MHKKKKTVNDFEKSNMTYFKEISHFIPLTKEEEHKLLDLYRNKHDLDARDKLIKANLKFVARYARNYLGRGLSLSDLIAEGNVGLIKSLDKFDLTRKNMKIFTYSVWWIKQAILEAIERRNGITGEELPADTENQFDSYSDNDDVYCEYNDNNESYLINNKIDENVDDYFKKKEMKEALNLMVSSLNEKERFMISEYYGLHDGKPKTLEEVGNMVGLTKERVRQINNNAFNKMRATALDNSITSDIYK